MKICNINAIQQNINKRVTALFQRVCKTLRFKAEGNREFQNRIILSIVSNVATECDKFGHDNIKYQG